MQGEDASVNPPRVVCVGAVVHGLTAAELEGEAPADAVPADFFLTHFADLDDGRRLSSEQTSRWYLNVVLDESGLITDDALVRAARVELDDMENPQDRWMPLIRPFRDAGLDIADYDLESLPREIELAPSAGRAAAEANAAGPSRRTHPMDSRVVRELDGLLRWAEGAKKGADQLHGGRVDGSCYGYVGGALTTLLHLDHITEAEFHEWTQRFIAIFGPPEGGFSYLR